MDVSMSYPRNRGSSEFVALRKQLLEFLNFATQQEQEYYL